MSSGGGRSSAPCDVASRARPSAGPSSLRWPGCSRAMVGPGLSWIPSLGDSRHKLPGGSEVLLGPELPGTRQADPLSGREFCLVDAGPAWVSRTAFAPLLFVQLLGLLCCNNRLKILNYKIFQTHRETEKRIISSNDYRRLVSAGSSIHSHTFLSGIF